MISVDDNAMGAICDSPADRVVDSPLQMRRSMSAQSLSSRAESFVSFGAEGEEVGGSEIRENSKLRNELMDLGERVAKIALRSDLFQRGAGILVSQVSESFSTSHGSRLPSEKLSDKQQK